MDVTPSFTHTSSPERPPKSQRWDIICGGFFSPNQSLAINPLVQKISLHGIGIHPPKSESWNLSTWKTWFLSPACWLVAELPFAPRAFEKESFFYLWGEVEILVTSPSRPRRHVFATSWDRHQRCPPSGNRVFFYETSNSYRRNFKHKHSKVVVRNIVFLKFFVRILS